MVPVECLMDQTVSSGLTGRSLRWNQEETHLHACKVPVTLMICFSVPLNKNSDSLQFQCTVRWDFHVCVYKREGSNTAYELLNKKRRFHKHYRNVHVLTVTDSPNVLPCEFRLHYMTSRKVPSTPDPLDTGHGGWVQRNLHQALLL